MFLNQTILLGAPHFVKNRELQSFSQKLLVEVEFVFVKLSYESSTLILYKELSSSILQSLSKSESVIRDTCPDLHFVHYIKAQMPSIDPVSSIIN